MPYIEIGIDDPLNLTTELLIVMSSMAILMVERAKEVGRKSLRSFPKT